MNDKKEPEPLPYIDVVEKMAELEELGPHTLFAEHHEGDE